jgi:hypothetical protein
MSQHDYVIANGTGAAVRSDLNNALAAIVSQNSGATEPATMYAYQWWADTTTGLLKLRNGANNAWITLRELDGTLTIEAGTVSAPGLAFASDLNTGVWSPGADQFAIATNGVERVEWGTSEVVFNDGGANYDFRIEGDTNSALFFVDASAEAVGIGTTSPSSELEVRNGVITAGKVSDVLIGRYSDAFPSSGAGYFKISTNNSSGTSGGMTVSTLVGGSLGEAFRVDDNRRLLVGTSTSTSTANVGSTQNIQAQGSSSLASISVIGNVASAAGGYLTLAKSRSTTPGGFTVVTAGDELGAISFEGADGSAYRVGASIGGVVDGTPGANDMPGRLVFSTTADGASSPTTRMQILNTGRVALSNLDIFYPTADNTVANGTSGFRWSAIWAANGTIQTSDQRAKTEVASATLGSNFIKSLRPVSYKWIEGGKRDTGERDENNNYIYESVPGTRTHWGFIAQEVKQAVDDSGVDFGGWVLTDKDDPDSQQALRYDQFIAPLTKALQEALAEIDVLKAKVAALESA